MQKASFTISFLPGANSGVVSYCFKCKGKRATEWDLIRCLQASQAYPSPSTCTSQSQPCWVFQPLVIHTPAGLCPSCSLCCSLPSPLSPLNSHSSFRSHLCATSSRKLSLTSLQYPILPYNLFWSSCQRHGCPISVGFHDDSVSATRL